MLHLARYSSVSPADFERALGITVGFDSMFDRLFGDVQRSESASGFPPYNIRKDQEEQYTIEMAVAGFAEEDLDIEYADNVLTVSSKDSDPFKDSKEPEYVHKGISARQFTKKFSLADDVIVNDASMKNGMLKISMEKVVPEGKKKRSIKIVSE